MKFPVIAFDPPRGQRADDGVEDVDWFLDEDSFTTLDISDLKRGRNDGMVVVDAAGRSWRILRTQDLGAKGRSWEKLLRIIFRCDRRVAYELSEERAVSFDTLKERVCASIHGNPDHWRDDEAIAGEDGQPRDEQEILEEKMEWCRRTSNVRMLVEVLKYSGNCQVPPEEFMTAREAN